ncbi:MAG: hypothetical protein RR428_10295 [Coprobacillus sp.]
MNDFSLEGLIFLVIILFLLVYGLFILIKIAVKTAIRELEEEKKQNK